MNGNSAPLTSRELVEANLKELGLSVAEAAKAIGVTRQHFTMSLTAEARGRRK
jgi:plasmid maintenance system antidote protein VapI